MRSRRPYPWTWVVLDVVHFGDLDDGRRLTSERSGEMSTELPRTSTLAEVSQDTSELIFEEEMREAAAEEIARRTTVR